MDRFTTAKFETLIYREKIIFFPIRVDMVIRLHWPTSMPLNPLWHKALMASPHQVSAYIISVQKITLEFQPAEEYAFGQSFLGKTGIQQCL